MVQVERPVLEAVVMRM